MVHIKGDEVKDVEQGESGQKDFDYFIDDMIVADPEDSNKRIVENLGLNDSIILFDYDDSKYRDFQDTIVLVRLIPVSGEGVINHITVVNDKLTKVSETLDIEAAASSSEKRNRNSNIQFNIQKTSGSEVEFSIENIDE